MSTEPAAVPASPGTDAVAQAVKFLGDPRVQASSPQARENFLRAKGLSDAEIQQATGQILASVAGLAPIAGDGMSLWGFLTNLGGFAAAMATGAFVYELWLQRSRGVPEPQSERAPVQAKTVGTGSEEDLVKTLRDFVARHEARQAEQNRLLRDLTAAVAELKEERASVSRKIGGSVVLSRTSSTNDDSSETPQPREEEQTVHPEKSMEILENLASVLSSDPARPTVIMILQNLSTHFEDERFRKINLSSARFRDKIGQGVPLQLLQLAGFAMDGNTLVFPKEGALSRVTDVLKAVEGFVESE